MKREYRQIAWFTGEEAAQLLQALKEELPIEFERRGDCVIVKVCTSVTPACINVPLYPGKGGHDNRELVWPVK